MTIAKLREIHKYETDTLVKINIELSYLEVGYIAGGAASRVALGGFTAATLVHGCTPFVKRRNFKPRHVLYRYTAILGGQTVVYKLPVIVYDTTTYLNLIANDPRVVHVAGEQGCPIF